MLSCIAMVINLLLVLPATASHHGRTLGRVSIDVSGGQPQQGNDSSYLPAVSSDGSVIAFQSSATNLLPDDTQDANGVTDIYVWEAADQSIERVSVGSAPDFMEANGASGDPDISADGNRIVFESAARNIASGAPTATNIFLHDRATDETILVSRTHNGTSQTGDSLDPTISGNGRYVAFYSKATNLVPNDTASWDIFLYDVEGDTLTEVTTDRSGSQTDANSYWPSLSYSGTLPFVPTPRTWSTRTRTGSSTMTPTSPSICSSTMSPKTR